jgi:hypothetical protein
VTRLEFTPQEEVELLALLSLAWALRGTDAYRPALETICDWRQDLLGRRAQTLLARLAAEEAARASELERRHEQWGAAAELSVDELVQLLHETDPDRQRAKAAA